jgi:NNP family nitrate/nitrite transporter-like MFS transporter
MAGLVTSPQGLIALRFFIGILGATFVPCQVWCTGFFDKNVVGTANALAGGFGNAGGGITYFVMPAIYDSLVHSQGLTPHRAWRVAYVVPFIIIVALALSMLFLCEDTPTGKWSQRNDNNPIIQSNIVDLQRSSGSGAPSSTNVSVPEKKGVSTPQIVDTEAQPVIDISLANNEMIQKPTLKEALRVIFSLPTVAVALPYACSFGAELAINSILGAYYLKNFPSLGQTKSGRWAAMFGLVNVVFRPAGGFIADIIYRYTKSVWGKKVWLVCLGVCMGGSALAVGLLNPKSEGLMFGLVVLMAFFIAASNGANFAIVPHVHPTANGIVSGIVGGMGNFGGIVFAIIFRYSGTHYDRALWIIGAIVAGVNLSVSWIRPVPRT